MSEIGTAMLNTLIILGVFIVTIVIPVTIGVLGTYMIVTSGIYFYKNYKNRL